MPRFAPENFKPSPKSVKWAMEKFQISKEEIENQTEQFVDYEFKRNYTDWNRAWRNWIRKADQLQLLSRAHRPRRTQEELTPEQRKADRDAWQRDMARFEEARKRASNAGS